MEYKKLLKFLKNDLTEVEELVAEKGKNGFDELEMVFVQNRLKEAKNLIELIISKNLQTEKVAEEPKIINEKPEVAPEKETVEVIHKKKEEIEQEKEKKEIEIKVENKPEPAVKENDTKNNEIELEDEEKSENDKRLGDTFFKEKSVNDLREADTNNIEKKISNRPVTSIKMAIGINDRFQYIRELFNGNADDYTKTVEHLDSLIELKEAVTYLQKNFKWKKTETSLKFVNLVKRRFPND